MKKYLVAALFVLLAFSLSALFLLDNEEIKAQNQTYEVGDLYSSIPVERIHNTNTSLPNDSSFPGAVSSVDVFVSSVDSSGYATSLILDKTYYQDIEGYIICDKTYTIKGSAAGEFYFSSSFSVADLSNVNVNIDFVRGTGDDVIVNSYNFFVRDNGHPVVNSELNVLFSAYLNSFLSQYDYKVTFVYNRDFARYFPYLNSVVVADLHSGLTSISDLYKNDMVSSPFAGISGMNFFVLSNIDYFYSNRLILTNHISLLHSFSSFIIAENKDILFTGVSPSVFPDSTGATSYSIGYEVAVIPSDYSLNFDGSQGLTFITFTFNGSVVDFSTGGVLFSFPVFLLYENGLYYFPQEFLLYFNFDSFILDLSLKSSSLVNSDTLESVPIDTPINEMDYIYLIDYTTASFFSVTFDLNGGTLVAGSLYQSVVFGGTVQPPKVSRDGYRFNGWLPDDFVITKDTVFVAQWEKTYQVTFDLGELGYFSDSSAGYENYGNTVTVTVLEGSTADWRKGSIQHIITAGYVELSGWSQSLENVQSDMTVTAVYTGVDYAVSFLPGNTSFSDGSPVKYATVNYMTGFSVSLDDLGYEIPVGHDLVFNGSYVVSLDSESDRTVRLNNFVLSDYKKFFTNLPVLNPFDFEDLTDVQLVAYVDLIDYTVSFTYIDNFDLSTVTKTYTVKYGNKLASYLIPQPVNYTGNYFIYWQDKSSENFKYQDIVDLVIMQDYDFTAIYSPSIGFSVTFYYQFEKLRTLEFQSGIGTISPPNFSFPVGVQFYGWSLELNGALLDLSSYSLEQDVDLYAVTNFSSSSGDVSFDIPYNDCQWYDIPCHLGNAFIYFINDFPIISDIVSFIVPVGTLVSLFVDNILLLDTLGWIFTIGIAIFFVAFIFRFMR